MSAHSSGSFGMESSLARCCDYQILRILRWLAILSSLVGSHWATMRQLLGCSESSVGVHAETPERNWPRSVVKFGILVLFPGLVLLCTFLALLGFNHPLSGEKPWDADSELGFAGRWRHLHTCRWTSEFHFWLWAGDSCLVWICPERCTCLRLRLSMWRGWYVTFCGRLRCLGAKTLRRLSLAGLQRLDVGLLCPLSRCTHGTSPRYALCSRCE